MRYNVFMAILDEIRTGILENAELDGNEKICLVAMLCAEDLSGIEDLSKLMGVTFNTAQMAVRSLRLKGFLKNSEIGKDDEEVKALHKLLERESEVSVSFPADSPSSPAQFPQKAEGHRSVFDALGKRGDVRGMKLPRGFREPESHDAGGDDTESAPPDFYTAAEHDSRFSPAAQVRPSRSAESAKVKDESSRILELTKALNLDPDVPKNSAKKKAAALYKKDSAVAKAAKQLKESKLPEYSVEDFVSSAAAGSGRSSGAGRDRELSLEDKVMHLIEESITRSEAAIILGFAGGDYEKVESTYKRIRGTQIKDKVDALVKLLQAEHD